MPSGAHQECRVTRCRNYAVRGGYCDEHRRAASQRPAHIQIVARLQTCARFRRARHSFLVRHPVCNRCKREAASILDHVIPHRGSLDLFWTQTNWQALCVHCHAVKTAGEVLNQA
jgi:5-methylcytosine-specific restriction endonuclease McrA